MKWIKEKPKTEGFYWVFCNGIKKIVEIYKDDTQVLWVDSKEEFQKRLEWSVFNNYLWSDTSIEEPK